MAIPDKCKKCKCRSCKRNTGDADCPRSQHECRCSICELAGINAITDCKDYNSGWGGKRPGAGQPPRGRRVRSWRLTDAEYEKVKAFIASMK